MLQQASMLGCFNDKLHATTNLDELQHNLQNDIASLGFRYFAYHVVKVAGVGNHLPCFATTYPQPWVDHYINENYAEIDPIEAIGPKKAVPFLWNEIACPDHVQGRQAKLFSEADDLHIKNGLSIPIHGRQGDFAIMSFVPDGSQRETEALLREHRGTLHLMALYYDDHAGKILKAKYVNENRRTVALTGRERECLQWVAVGKTTWEISVILSVSEACVVFHVENAKRKLNATNRIHAVVRAITLGLIDPE